MYRVWEWLFGLLELGVAILRCLFIFSAGDPSGTVCNSSLFRLEEAILHYARSLLSINYSLVGRSSPLRTKAGAVRRKHQAHHQQSPHSQSTME